MDFLSERAGDPTKRKVLFDKFLVWIGGLAITFRSDPIELNGLLEVISRNYETLGNFVISHRMHGLNNETDARPFVVFLIMERSFVLIPCHKFDSILHRVSLHFTVKLLKSATHRHEKCLSQVSAQF